MRALWMGLAGFALGVATQSASAGYRVWNAQDIEVISPQAEYHLLRAHLELDGVDAVSAGLSPSELSDVCDSEDPLATLLDTAA